MHCGKLLYCWHSSLPLEKSIEYLNSDHHIKNRRNLASPTRSSMWKEGPPQRGGCCGIC